jgi:hypothetical protein
MPATLPDCRWNSPCHVLTLFVRVIPRRTPHSVLSGMVPDFLPKPLLNCEHERAGKSREIGRFGWDVGCRGTERFNHEGSSGMTEEAERPKPSSQRKRRAAAPSSSWNEHAWSKVAARVTGREHDAERALVPVVSGRGNLRQVAHS